MDFIALERSISGSSLTGLVILELAEARFARRARQQSWQLSRDEVNRQ